MLIKKFLTPNKTTHQAQQPVLQAAVAHEVVNQAGAFPIKRPPVEGDDVGVAILGQVVEFVAQVVVVAMRFDDGSRQRVVVVLRRVVRVSPCFK